MKRERMKLWIIRLSLIRTKTFVSKNMFLSVGDEIPTRSSNLFLTLELNLNLLI